MTTHYGETVTADQIIQGWIDHGETLPLAYGTFTWGDLVAYNCWGYLYTLTLKAEDAPTPEEYFSRAPEEKKDEVIQILKDVVELFNQLPKKKESERQPWPLNKLTKP